ncbi:MAG: hypothetical protein ACLSE7_00940 [Lachnospirales bacterium]
MNEYCERCYLRDAKPCMECSACFPGHRNFRPTPSVPGAAIVDKAAHRVYLAAGSNDDVRWRPSGVKCKECGEELETYYCEERLYAVRCRKCETVMLVKSRGPGLAAIRFARISREGAEQHGETETSTAHKNLR